MVSVPSERSQDRVLCLIDDQAFSEKSDGAVHDNALARLVDALLFVAVTDAPQATRFANGDWSQVAAIMPMITRIMAKIGWSSDVMSKSLTLCEQAADAYPIRVFSQQVAAALESIHLSQGSWTGTTLPARIAATIQRLTDKHYPLEQDQALALLRILDALIDLGDRRSSALEQSEAFREVRKTADGSQ